MRDWKEYKTDLTNQIDEANKKLVLISEKAMDDEQQEELKRDYDMKFTGKAIAVFSKQKIAYDIVQQLSLFNTQNPMCNSFL